MLNTQETNGNRSANARRGAPRGCGVRLPRRRIAAPLLALGLGVSLPGVVAAQSDALAVGAASERFGLAHVDVMDLHMVRHADKPPSILEQLPAADVAERYRVAAATGARRHRWSMYWDLIDRGGTFDWRVSDGIVARDVAHGLATLAVLQGNAPGAAAGDGAPPGLDAPVFLSSDGSLTDDPADASAIHDGNPWARFVAATVDRYRPGGVFASAQGWPAGAGVRTWEIGNEPNLTFFWRGTPAEYARFLEVAYLAAKWRDPLCTVLHAGIANDANAASWFGQFLDALVRKRAAGPLPARYGYYFDKTAWHWYTVPSNLTVAAPTRVAAMLSERGIPPKPLWVTEFGAPIWSEYPGPCWDPDSPLRVSAAEHAAFVWQAVVEGMVASAQTMILFQLYDDCGNGRSSYDAFGLVRNHAANQCWDPPGHGCWRYDANLAGTPRPSYDAFRHIVRELDGASVSRVTAPQAWQVVEFHRPPDTRVTIAWSKRRSAQVVQLPAGAATAVLYAMDEAGRISSSSVAPVDGSVPLYLPGATNRNGLARAPLVDGRPVMLVERGVAAFPAQRGAGSSGTALAADTEPPYLAMVRALPAESEPIMELTMVAGDSGSNLGLFQFHYAVGTPPFASADWSPIGTPLPWPAGGRTGVVSVPFVGAPGSSYAFAGRAADVAGNWSDLPTVGQASTHVRSHIAPAPRVPSSLPSDAKPRTVPRRPLYQSLGKPPAALRASPIHEEQ